MTNRFIQLTFFRRISTIQDSLQAFDRLVTPEAKGVTQKTDYLTLSSDLKVSFKIDSVDKGWTGNIKIYNLSPESSEFLLSSDSSDDLVMVHVDAGYTDNHGRIASVYIRGVRQYTDGGNFITELIVNGSQSQLNQKSSVSFFGMTTADKIIKKVLDDAFIPWVDEITPYIDEYGMLEHETVWTPKDYAMGNAIGVVNLLNHGYAYTGTVKSVLDKYIRRIRFPVPIKRIDVTIRDDSEEEVKAMKANRAGITWKPCSYYEGNDGVIHLTVPEELIRRKGSEVFVSADTGLIEIPRPSLYVPRKKNHKTKKKLEIKHTLVPQIELGGWVHLKLSGRYSKFKDGGKYLVNGVRYRGNNYDGEHTVSIEVNQ